MLPHRPQFAHVDTARATLTPLSHSNNAVFRVTQGAAQYVLKWFTPERGQAFHREQQMRACLAAHTTIAFPRILETVAHAGHQYVLMEAITGDSLLARWQARTGPVPDSDLRRLGALLAQLHAVPLAAAAAFIEPETVFFSEAYAATMQQAITPHLPDRRDELAACCHHVRAVQDRLPAVLAHADYGPHQIIVQAGAWRLLDFEFATISPFADDLSGTEVRLMRWGFTRDAFLDGYFSIHPRRERYAPVRRAFMAYNLLAIITYGMRVGTPPAAADLDLLRSLLPPASDT